MNDSTKQLINYGAMAAAVYFLYQWLQSSGLWAKWFGGSTTASNQFNNSAALLSYCQANPNGTAIYVDPTSGASSTATCAQWLASNSQSPMQVTSPASGLAANYQQAISLMQQAAGSDSQTLDTWSYYWQNGMMFDGCPAGFGVSGSISASQFNQILALNGNNRDTPVSAEQFVAWVSQTAPVTTGGPIAAGVITTGGTGQGTQGYDFGEAYRSESEWVN
jgi:hypothetical protein